MTPPQQRHHLAAIRRIEQEEDSRANLERLRELHQGDTDGALAAIEGVFYQLLEAQDASEVLQHNGLTGVQIPGTITTPDGYVLLESE